ncbi:MAG: DUF5317 domain-containing protein [Eubacteriales bacterium]|nr:DUF5317 domain-containing protein [Eubacteriales bacterium]
MVVEIIAVCLLAKWKGYQLKYLFRTWTFYPILLVQCILVLFQASIFLRRFIFIQFVPYTEAAVILSFLFAILAFKLYKLALLGSASILTGTLLNKLVLSQNGGKMPVYPTLSYLTGYVTPEILNTADALHVPFGSDTHLKFLTDYIDYGYCILSVGDLFIHLFVCIILYALIKAVNLRYGAKPAKDK